MEQETHIFSRTNSEIYFANYFDKYAYILFGGLSIAYALLNPNSLIRLFISFAFVIPFLILFSTHFKKSKDQIIFPFLIIGDPIAQRIAFPIIEVLWVCGTALAIALSFAIVKFSFISADYLGPMLLFGLFFLSVVCLLFYAANIAIKRLLYDTLTINSDKIFYYSKLTKSKKEFNIDQIDKIVLEKYCGNHATVIINEKNEPRVLIDKVVILYGMGKLERLVEELGHRTSLNVCKIAN